MSETDDHLIALFSRDAPSARDPAFTLAVMEKVAHRRFVVDVLMLTVLTLLGGCVLWSAWPALVENLAPLIKGHSPAIASLTLAFMVVILLEGPVTAAPGMKHD
ncbi:hypothetical protein [Phenylobacterium sp.]|jgi:hypothetical protein|uniref:hypothetical protein n=1 Tax=Phenylobacterium sp. TaxID=1871053 RepID=UPI0037C8CC58